MLLLFLQHVTSSLNGFLTIPAYNFARVQCRGKTHKKLHFVLFAPFLKLDGDEADKLCGEYTSRGKNVAQLCRYCECPTDKCDDPLAKYKPKTQRQIQGLIAQNETQLLQRMSQHCLNNAFYKVRFGAHNMQKGHGACPMDMLHALLLGIFRYVRDCFFEQVGPSSDLASSRN